jgi:hypothetical protein
VAHSRIGPFPLIVLWFCHTYWQGTVPGWSQFPEIIANLLHQRLWHGKCSYQVTGLPHTHASDLRRGSAVAVGNAILVLHRGLSAWSSSGQEKERPYEKGLDGR